ncbi:uncharacterized protein EV154DRAFT_492150 [Mucor mucedo]|uniref:uncharacterized protein n=1 Tax=Mucor mucedo TaxID=29922 RepID=UPI00221EE574|nr:uncharacterized protein EV154DRAFT_492150 [Mucor mucedo]KAI7896412.1 hypothetical protein EV154DRAFT_492150 [Mucor mucedo]
MSNHTFSDMFSEAEQNKLQSFLTDLEQDHSSQHQNIAESSTSKKRKDHKRKTPYDRKSNSPEEESASRRTGRARKQAHELLSEDQKKANHIASEQKRRANIKIGFDQLVDMVPTLDGSHRSESLVLQKCKRLNQFLFNHSNL